MKLKEAVCVLEHLAAEFNGAEYITNAIYKVLDKLEDRKDYMEVLNACLDFQAEEIEELIDSNINLNRKLVNENSGVKASNFELIEEIAVLKKDCENWYEANKWLTYELEKIRVEKEGLLNKHGAVCEGNAKLVEANRVLAGTVRKLEWLKENQIAVIARRNTLIDTKCDELVQAHLRIKELKETLDKKEQHIYYLNKQLAGVK